MIARTTLFFSLLIFASSVFAESQPLKITPLRPSTLSPTTTLAPDNSAADAAVMKQQVDRDQQIQQMQQVEIQKQQQEILQQRAEQMRNAELQRRQAPVGNDGRPIVPQASPGYSVVSPDEPSVTSTTQEDYKEFVSTVTPEKNAKKKKKGGPMFAIFETSKGKIKVKLYDSLAPKTVDNFVELAKGTKPWMDPKSNTMVSRPFYDGLIFHRVIPHFMIQGGDPVGNGTGGPGYQFDDEIVPTLHHNKPGIVSMANAGPNTNGSQFFITTEPHTHLDGHYSIFGEVVEGMHVVEEISKVKRNSHDLPLEPVVIKHVKIEQK
jgi:peptidyl-prolyl cis-trans isomerase A (cyclophilin A)